MTTYHLTVIAPTSGALSDSHITDLQNLLSHANVTCFTTTWLAEGEAWDAEVRTESVAALRDYLKPFAEKHALDYGLQPTHTARRKGLLISDMDSTMIEQECIDELADMVGQKPYVSAITERAMRGELDFKQALKERVALLKGLPVNVLEEVFNTRITLMPGAQTLLATMRHQGAHCVLVSGGFTYFTDRVAARIGFHANEANCLEIEEGKLTGHVIEPILDKESKQRSLEKYREQLKLTPDATLAVGDGANDLPMLLAAGLGVAYHAKPHVQEQASVVINHADLRALLFLQGYKKSEWREE